MLVVFSPYYGNALMGCVRMTMERNGMRRYHIGSPGLHMRHKGALLNYC